MVVIEVIAVLLGLIFLLVLLIIVCKTRLTLRAEFQPGANQVVAELALINRLLKGTVQSDLQNLRVTVHVLGCRIPVYTGKLKKSKAKKQVPEKPPVPKATPKPPVRPRRKLTTGEWLKFGEGVVARIKAVLHFEKIRADLTIGLETPDQTGLLLGAFYFVRGALHWGSDCKLTPDFLQKKVEGWVEAAIFLHIVRLFPAGLFIFKQMRKAKVSGGDEC